jgi:hypothetical protein
MNLVSPRNKLPQNNFFQEKNGLAYFNEVSEEKKVL